MSSTTDEYAGDLFRVAEDFIAVAQKVRDDFQPLFEEAVASGDKTQLQEVKDYMNEEAQAEIKKLGEILGFEVDFEFDFDGEINFDEGVEVSCWFFDEAIPGGTPQA